MDPTDSEKDYEVWDCIDNSDLNIIGCGARLIRKYDNDKNQWIETKIYPKESTSS